MKAAKSVQPVIPGLASPYRRLIARGIDLVIGWFVILPLSIVVLIPISNAMGESESAKTAFGLIFAGFFVLVLIIYDTVMTALLGRTVGKMALGLRVVDINGDKLTLGNAFLRSLLLYFFGVVILFGIVITASILGWVFFAGLGKHQQFPHEKTTKSYVMMKSKSGAVEVIKVTPHDDLERLKDSGLISEEEYTRKRKELGY
ncbi:MAG: hypothetical protein C0401_12100 [Anaerolinea sp.]|nr:hypothetical protein [Anaerolinea sp.]